MANLGTTFDANTLPQGNGNFDPLPAGWYTATITQAELKDTKTGSGQYIKVRYDITGPTHQGRVVFGNINIRNQNAKAEEIGQQQLGDLMRSIGLGRVTDTDELLNHSVGIKLKVREQEGYDPTNDVAGFKAAGGGSAAPKVFAAHVPLGSQSASVTQAAPAASAPPWANKK